MQLSGLADRPEAAGRASCRRLPAAVERQQLRRRQLDRGAPAQHRRIPVQPDRPERPRSVHRSASTIAATDAHRFEGVYSYFKETDDRTDLDFISPDRPLVYTSSDPKRFALAWRWAASSNFQNELRGGANLAPVAVRQRLGLLGDGVLYNTALGIINPVGGNGERRRRLPAAGPLHRHLSVERQRLADCSGSHQLQMGGSWQRNQVNPYNFAGQFPQVTFGFSTAAPASVQLTTAQFPGGISAADLANANAMAAWLGGIVTSVAQTFQVKDKTSGYVPGIPSNENYTLDNIAALRPGQLALEAELHRPRRPEVGVLQPAARGRRPRLPAGPRRPSVRAGDARSERDASRSSTATSTRRT